MSHGVFSVVTSGHLVRVLDSTSRASLQSLFSLFPLILSTSLAVNLRKLSQLELNILVCGPVAPTNTPLRASAAHEYT